MPVSSHYQYLPHLLSYAAQSVLLPQQSRSLDPQSQSLVTQLVASEDLEPLCTPMLIEDGWAAMWQSQIGGKVIALANQGGVVEVDDAVTLYNATLTHIIDTVAPLTTRTIKKD
ncbi:UNVERIFIED_CONTAM: hypothetical protein FKN15_018776 [Acipenser sinensis]